MSKLHQDLVAPVVVVLAAGARVVEVRVLSLHLPISIQFGAKYGVRMAEHPDLHALEMLAPGGQKRKSLDHTQEDRSQGPRFTETYWIAGSNGWAEKTTTLLHCCSDLDLKD